MVYGLGVWGSRCSTAGFSGSEVFELNGLRKVST